MESPHHTRRRFLTDATNGLAGIALASMLGRGSALAGTASVATPALNGGLHHRARARQVIQLFMNGGASQCDLFDYRPLLIRRHGQPFDPGTGERVEAVVTVDGRDVVSGELGNYKRQRGYVIEAYGSVVIEGFRQSLDQVAAFRFTDIGNSYSARRGSGQHVGVIGVAVFKEYQPRRARPQPTPIATRPYYEPYGGGGYDYRDEASKRAGEASRTGPAHRGGD